MKLRNKIRRLLNRPAVRIASFILLFAIIATVGLLNIKAAGPTVGKEAESGSSPVPCSNTSGASGGGCVQFCPSAGCPSGGTLSAPVTALALVGTDKIVSNAICIDNSANVSGTSPTVTACMQIKPDDSTKARFGTYDDLNKVFTPIAGGWQAITNHNSALQAHSFACSGSTNNALGLGPLGSNYYGEELKPGNVIGFGTVSNGSCNTSGGGTLSNTQWTASLNGMLCKGGAGSITASNLTDLQNYVNNGGHSEVCISSGTYVLTTSLKPKANVRLIGDPINRPIIDAKNLPQAPGQDSAITSSGAGVTVASLIVRGSKGSPATGCKNCGQGINGGDNYVVYNVKMTNNDTNGYHYHHPGSKASYLLENSELSNNGDPRSLGNGSAASGGLKTTHGGIILHNVSINNQGVGFWCDVGCTDKKWDVENNYVADNLGGGIRYEISGSTSTGAEIKANVVQNNNLLFLTAGGRTYNGGIEIVNSSDTTVENNILLSNKVNGIVAHYNSGQPHALARVIIRNNFLHSQPINSCSASGVTCTNNHP